MLRGELRSPSNLVHLSVLYGLGNRCRFESCLVTAGFALITSMALTMPIAPNLVAATFSAKVFRITYKASDGFYLNLAHRPVNELSSDK